MGKPSSMLKSPQTATLFFLTLISFASCGLDCVDKKTGMHKSSRTLEEAQANGLYKYEFVPDKRMLQLDSGLVFKVKNAWVENSWRYECIDNKAEVSKDSTYQFVIEPEYNGDAINSNYWLGNSRLGAVLEFRYSGQDTLKLTLYKDTSYTLTNNTHTIDNITFVKRLVSR